MAAPHAGQARVTAAAPSGGAVKASNEGIQGRSRRRNYYNQRLSQRLQMQPITLKRQRQERKQINVFAQSPGGSAPANPHPPHDPGPAGPASPRTQWGSVLRLWGGHGQTPGTAPFKGSLRPPRARQMEAIHGVGCAAPRARRPRLIKLCFVCAARLGWEGVMEGGGRKTKKNQLLPFNISKGSVPLSLFCNTKLRGFKPLSPGEMEMNGAL